VPSLLQPGQRLSLYSIIRSCSRRPPLLATGLAFVASPVVAGLRVGGRGYPRDGESGVGGHGKPQ